MGTDLASLPKASLVSRLRRAQGIASRVAQSSAKATAVVASGGGAIAVGIMHSKWPQIRGQSYVTPGMVVGAILTAMGAAEVGGEKAAHVTMSVGQGMLDGHLAIVALQEAKKR